MPVRVCTRVFSQVLNFFDWLVRFAGVFHEVVLHYGIPYHGENELDTIHSHVAQALFTARSSLLTLEQFQQVIAARNRTCEVRTVDSRVNSVVVAVGGGGGAYLHTIDLG